MSDPVAKKTPGAKVASDDTSIPQALLEFLGRYLDKFSPAVRNIIGLTIVFLLVIVVLHGSMAPTYVRGRLWIRDAPGAVKIQAKRYILNTWGENVLVDENGRWMMPISGFVPHKTTVDLKDAAGNGIGEFSFWGPWPVWNALYVSEHEVIVHTYESGADRIKLGSIGGFPAVWDSLRFLTGTGTAYAQQLQEKPSQQPYMLVHLAGLGDVACPDGGWCGTKGESRRLEGFQITLPKGIPDLRLKYSCKVEGLNGSEIRWLNEGEFCGTRNQQKKLEGFSVRIEGPAAREYNVLYRAHFKNSGDTGIFQNGQVMVAPGNPTQVEAIQVSIERR